MQTKIILLGCFFCLSHFNSCVAEKQKLDESIVNYFQKSDGLQTTPFPAFAFCIPEISFALQTESTFSNFWARKSGHLIYLKNDAKDFYLTKLMQVKFLKDSLIAYNMINKNATIKRLIDTLNLVPEYKLQKQDLPLFFKSFTDESGVGAEKIETLLITQNLDIIFDYIENNEQAKERFLEWIDEDIEVWCPSVGTDNRELNNRIKKYLYERLSTNNSPLAQQAVKKMKAWFGY